MTKDIPIIFSAPMVQALLEGRKTMTRRMVKPAPHLAQHQEPVRVEPRGERGWVWMVYSDRPDYQFATNDWQCRYAVGDRLWVREAFMPRPGLGNIAKPHYRCDNDRPEWRGLWKPSIHMPRWASRLTLIVTGVKVERLMSLSWKDAIAEGVVDKGRMDGEPYGHCYVPGINLTMEHEPMPVFFQLWERLHGDGSVVVNPWVVAITFTVHKTNIDRMAKIAA